MKGWLLFYLLVLVRILALFSSMPLINQKKLPSIWKVAVALLFTLILAPLLTPREFQPHPVWVVLAVIWEGVVGLSLGLVFTSAVGAVLSAGSLIDMQMGFSNASILNPGGDQPEPLVASFYRSLFLLSALVGGFHLAMIRVLLESFNWFPVGVVLHRFKDLGTFGLLVVDKFFVSLVWMVLPVSLALLAVEVCLAFLSRVLPQMNMLIAAAPFRVLAGFVLLILALPLTLDLMSKVLMFHLGAVEVLRV